MAAPAGDDVRRPILLAPTGTTEHSRYFIAASSGNLKLLKQYAEELSNGAGGLENTFATLLDRYGRNALHYASCASEAGKATCLFLLNDMKIDVNCKDKLGWTPLHHAIDHGGDVGMMDLLLSNGADIESTSKIGTPTPLLVAVGHGNHVAVDFLLSRRADPNASGGKPSYTPLLISILANALDCLKLLLKYGADPNQDSRGVWPLVTATDFGRFDMVKYLKEEGANLDPCITSKAVIDFNEKGKDKYEKGEYRNAADCFTKAITLDPTVEMLFRHRGLCWFSLGEWDEAFADALGCVMLNPNTEFLKLQYLMEEEKMHFGNGSIIKRRICTVRR